ncbi:hypothetical protein [Pseudoalteromonas mariniglutinosa]|uniref:hypothetical protein n=1 Tax=Pseudoalteromonas mariniglutinosa TaxID=206042 RepID=UPI00384DA54D
MTAPNWLKPLAWAALIWNLLGVIAFVMQMMISPEMLSKLPAEQQVAYANTPIWSTIAFAVAVFAGSLGCVFLLAKKALAYMLFIASLIAIIIQQYYNFMVIDSIALFGSNALLMPTLVIIAAIILLLVSRRGKTERWLS